MCQRNEKIFLVQFALVFSGFIGALQITINIGNHHFKLSKDFPTLPVASWALHIHEIAVRVLHQALQLVLPEIESSLLKTLHDSLYIPLFLSGLRVQQISCKRHLSSLKV